MRILEYSLRTYAQPSLRIYYGDETDDAAVAPIADHDQMLRQLDVEIEEYWAGRKPAARFSARVAA
jgi:hypothetical protein